MLRAVGCLLHIIGCMPSAARCNRPRVALLARLAFSPYVISSLRLLRRRGLHEAGDVREPAVAAARARLDGRRAGVEADDARFPVGRHFGLAFGSARPTKDRPSF